MTLNGLHYNQKLRVFEQSSTGDGDARVNQFGIHNHGAGMRRNAVEAAVDAVGMIPGLGTIAHGGNAVRHLFSGDFGSALTSGLKGLASLVPGLGTIVSGASLMKNTGDTMMHAGGWMEQQTRFGGYENQTRMAQQMFGGNAMGSASLFYGANPYAMPRW